MDSRGYDHAALLYHSEREYVDRLVQFISDGLELLEPTLVAVPGDRLASLRGALGDAAAEVTLADITDFGRNPGRILAGQLAFVERHTGQRVRIVAEPAWVGRSAFEYLACMQHEALANIAFAGTDITGLCPYDASCLDESVLADVRLTHPHIWQDGSRRHCPEYAVDAALDQCNQPLATSAAAVTHTVEQAEDLAGARRCGERYSRLLGMSAEQRRRSAVGRHRVGDQQPRSRRGACRMAFWYENGYVVCETRDMGYWADPLAGRRPPAAGGSGPYGLFVVNAIADLLRTPLHGRGHHDPGVSATRRFLRSRQLTVQRRRGRLT